MKRLTVNFVLNTFWLDIKSGFRKALGFYAQIEFEEAQIFIFPYLEPNSKRMGDNIITNLHPTILRPSGPVSCRISESSKRKYPPTNFEKRKTGIFPNLAHVIAKTALCFASTGAHLARKMTAASCPIQCKRKRKNRTTPRGDTYISPVAPPLCYAPV